MRPSIQPITIDCQYLNPEFAAAYLLVEGKKAAFIENNTAHSTPLLLEALREQGLTPDQVEFLIVTHVHLDHAGGSYSLLKACPQATLLAHPRAAPHLIDPSKLIASAQKVYGAEAFDKLYGEIKPIESHRVRIMQDGEVVKFGGRTLSFIYTRGHANHHFCIFDSQSQSIFTGDSFGIAYPLLQKHGLFIFPSTSPTDFDPTEARISIERILETKAKTAYLTHFGGVENLREAADQLNRHLDFSAELLNRANRYSEDKLSLDQYCKNELTSYFKTTLEKKGYHLNQKEWTLLDLDLDLNAAGIAHVVRKKRQAPKDKAN